MIVLKIYNNNKLTYEITDLKSIFAIIQNLKVNSKFDFICEDEECIISSDNDRLEFQNIMENEILLKLLCEKVSKFISQFNQNKIVINSETNCYKVKYGEEKEHEVLDIVLALDKNKKLTKNSKYILDQIIMREFKTWHQSFQAIENDESMTIYYDDRKMVLDKIISNELGKQISEEKSKYMDLFNGNPFRRF